MVAVGCGIAVVGEMTTRSLIAPVLMTVNGKEICSILSIEMLLLIQSIPCNKYLATNSDIF